jgi:predicted phosphodiesterase
MRLAIISDIHSNFQALQAVLAEIATLNIDGIVSLGDNIGYGPQPEEVIKTLKEHNVTSILGNHEYALNNQSYFKRLNPPTQFSLEITRSLMGKESLAYCNILPTHMLYHGGRFVHGCPPESVVTYLWDPSETRMARIFLSMPEKMTFFGHTHILSCYIEQRTQYQKKEVAIEEVKLEPDCRYIINPGSVGQPRDGINYKAKYGIWDQDAGIFEYRAVSYDKQATKSLLRERKFPESNALRLG